MALGRKIIINWLIKSKAIKDDERELYEYALNSMVLLLSPAIISIFLWISMNINSGILLYVVTVISVVELCVFSPIQSGNRNIEGKEKLMKKAVGLM